jgi:hypothetical protein
MCFSPTASFVAGVAISTVGVATLKNVKNKREIPFALVPLIFGIQQIIEGFVWLSFGWPSGVHEVFAVIYSVFALCGSMLETRLRSLSPLASILSWRMAGLCGLLLESTELMLRK